MGIEEALRSDEGQQLVRRVASAFDVDGRKAGVAIETLVDALSARIERSMLSRGGVADVATLLTRPAKAPMLSESTDLRSPAVADGGNQILDVLIGNKHLSRGIAARAASASGLDSATVEDMLPVVATWMVGQLQRQAQPAFQKLLRDIPGLVSAGGSPLPLPGDTIPPAAPYNPAPVNIPKNGIPKNGAGTPSSGSIDAGRPLPIPGDNIPGLGRRQAPDRVPDNPFDRLPDVVRRGGGPSVPGPQGGSLEDVIRSIIGSLLGSNRGVIGTMIQLFLIRWIASLIRGILSRATGSR